MGQCKHGYYGTLCTQCDAEIVSEQATPCNSELFGWSQERPTEVGWYWAQDITHCAGPHILRLHNLGGHIEMLTSGIGWNDKRLSDEFYDTFQWKGPLTPQD